MTDKTVKFPSGVWITPTHMEDLRPKPQMAELTETWFRSALQPRYQDDGSVLRTLTPPRRSAGLPVGLILLAVSILSAVAFVYGVIR